MKILPIIILFIQLRLAAFQWKRFDGDPTTRRTTKKTRYKFKDSLDIVKYYGSTNPLNGLRSNFPLNMTPGDCTKWIECWDGTKYENQCSDGLWWHPAIENCDYPGDYCDGSRPDPRCIDHTTNYFPHPTSCNRYIECHEGNSYEMACAPGLYFSDSHKTCVNAALSDCCQTSTQC
jgi:hypothetical protein